MQSVKETNAGTFSLSRDHLSSDLSNLEYDPNEESTSSQIPFRVSGSEGYSLSPKGHASAFPSKPIYLDFIQV